MTQLVEDVRLRRGDVREAVSRGVREDPRDGVGRLIDRVHGLAVLRQVQRKPAVVAEAVQQPSPGVARRRFAVLPLIEEQAGLLAVTHVHVVGDGALPHFNRVGDVA